MKAMWLRAAMVSCAFVLASCGGGGDDGGPDVKVSSDRTSLDMTGFAGEGISQTVNFTLMSGAGTYYADVVVDRPSDFSATFTPTGDTTAAVTLTRLGSAAVGQGSGTMVFRLCPDTACRQVVWSQTVPYQYAVYAIDRTAIAFAGYEGSAANPRVLTVSPADTENRLVVSSTMSSGSGWLTATRSSAGGITVAASAASLAAGSYQGSVQVRISGAVNAPTLQVPVTFTVGSGLVAPAAGQLELTAEAAVLSGTANVAFNGAAARAWTATSGQSWLVLDTPSGTGAGALAYHVDFTRIGDLANWQSATAQVTVRAAGLSDVTFPVTLNKRLPEVHVTSPATVAAGRPATVRVIGRGLSQLTGVGRIHIVGATGVTGTVISDREAVLNIPALAVGRATVSVTNAAGIAAWNGTLGVATPAAIPAGSVANAGEKRSALFDPTRNALFAVNLTQNTLVRYRHVGGQWLVDGLPIAATGDLALSPDRKTLYVGSGDSLLIAVDPDTMQVRTTHIAPAQTAGTISPSRYFTYGMAVTNDLRVWFGGSQWSGMAYFDMRSGTFGSQSVGQGVSLYSPEFYASGDGSKLFVVNPPMLSPALPSYLFNLATEVLSTPASLPMPYRRVAFDETGAKALIDDETLYDTSNYSLIGAAAISGAIGTNAVLSPDGTRLYRQVTANNNSLVVHHIDVYDTTRVVPGTSAFVLVDQLPVTTQALDCGSQPAYGCDVRGAFVISPLGDTLFWVGNQRLVVIPIPSLTSGIQSASPRLFKAVGR